jgi:hypothetical protein
VHPALLFDVHVLWLRVPACRSVSRMVSGLGRGTASGGFSTHLLVKGPGFRQHRYRTRRHGNPAVGQNGATARHTNIKDATFSVLQTACSRCCYIVSSHFCTCACACVQRSMSPAPNGCVRCSTQDVLERAEATLRFGRARLLSSSTQVLGADAGYGMFHGRPTLCRQRKNPNVTPSHALRDDTTTLHVCKSLRRQRRIYMGHRRLRR